MRGSQGNSWTGTESAPSECHADEISGREDRLELVCCSCMLDKNLSCDMMSNSQIGKKRFAV